MLENVVGNAIEVNLLKSLPPATDLGSGLTAGQRVADLRHSYSQIRKTTSLETFFGGMTDRDLIDYINTAKAQGEWEAFQQWKAKGR